jgi:hypothetical protein
LRLPTEPPTATPPPPLDEALPLLLRRRSLLAPVARLDDLPTGERTVLPVAPGRLSSRVYLLGKAGDDLGGRVEIEDGAPDARAEVGEEAVGDRLLVHQISAVLPHPAEGVPGVVREVIVVVDVDLLAREELLVRELARRAPFPRGRPRALLAQEASKSSKKLLTRDLLPVRRVLRPLLPPQEPGEVVEEPPVVGEVEDHRDPRRAVRPLDPVRGMTGRGRGRPSERTVGAEGETYPYLHSPQILTHRLRRRRSRTLRGRGFRATVPKDLPKQ